MAKENIQAKVLHQMIYAVPIALFFLVAVYLLKGTSVINAWIGGILAVFGFITLISFAMREIKAIMSPQKDFWKVTVAGLFKLVVGIVAIIIGMMLLGMNYAVVLGWTALVMGLLGFVSWLFGWFN